MDIQRQFEIARKVKKVIESCNTQIQLEGARTYLNLFFQRYTKPSGKFLGKQTIEAEQTTVELYNDLHSLWSEKNNKFTYATSFDYDYFSIY